MRRRLATIFAVLSLVLLIGTAALWVRSYFTGDYLSVRSADGDRHSISSTNGTLLAERQSNVIYQADGVPPNGFAYRQLDPRRYKVRKRTTPTQWRSAGFGVVINRGAVTQLQKSARPGAWQNTVILVPHWAVVVLFAVPVGLWIRAAIRARRNARLHLCPTCGYDLRATPDRCPECGEVPATRPPHNQPMQRTGAAV